jgi:hypothetical protein
MVLNGCESTVIREFEFWQRVSASEAAYIQGPKAQQMLDRDIARCVVELRELERLGALRNTIPTDFAGRVLNPDETRMRDWDTPEREGDLLAEHGDYHDFEGCMLDKGWERVLSVPYNTADKARTNYLISHKEYKHYSRYQERKNRIPDQSDGAYGAMNP